MKPRTVFGISTLVTTSALLIGWRFDPSFNSLPTPGTVVFWAVCGFIMASLLMFSTNAMFALARGRKAKSEEELESILVPALEGRECDDRILKWTEIPRAIACGMCLGAICASGIHHFTR